MTAKNEDIAVELQYEMTSIAREETGLNEHAASQLADAIVQGLRRRFGGDYLYIPAADKRKRDDDIRREFNGLNRKEVCKKYNVSKSRLYEIVVCTKE